MCVTLLVTAVVMVREEEDNMNVINTAAPIAIEDLKKYFTDKTSFYVIDYKESKLKGSKLITYLSNLDLPCDIDINVSGEEFYSLVQEYMISPMLVNIRSLEFAAMDVIQEAKGISDNGHKEFIDQNKDLVDSWISKLDSLTLYNMYMINSEETKKFAQSFPKEETDSVVGVNFVSLLKHPEFYSLYQKIEEDKLKFYEKYFNEYMFKGRNMYSFWANENNPLFLLTFGIGEGQISPDEYVDAKEKSLQGIANASSV
jgi:hypothetical protein